MLDDRWLSDFLVGLGMPQKSAYKILIAPDYVLPSHVTSPIISAYQWRGMPYKKKNIGIKLDSILCEIENLYIIDGETGFLKGVKLANYFAQKGHDVKTVVGSKIDFFDLPMLEKAKIIEKGKGEYFFSCIDIRGEDLPIYSEMPGVHMVLLGANTDVVPLSRESTITFERISLEYLVLEEMYERLSKRCIVFSIKNFLKKMLPNLKTQSSSFQKEALFPEDFHVCSALSVGRLQKMEDHLPKNYDVFYLNFGDFVAFPQRLGSTAFKGGYLPEIARKEFVEAVFEKLIDVVSFLDPKVLLIFNDKLGYAASSFKTLKDLAEKLSMNRDYYFIKHEKNAWKEIKANLNIKISQLKSSIFDFLAIL